MVDFTKPIKTRDGRKVRILCTDANSKYPVVGLITDGQCDIHSSWTIDGRWTEQDTHPDNNLVNYAPRLRITFTECKDSPRHVGYGNWWCDNLWGKIQEWQSVSPSMRAYHVFTRTDEEI